MNRRTSPLTLVGDVHERLEWSQYSIFECWRHSAVQGENVIKQACLQSANLFLTCSPVQVLGPGEEIVVDKHAVLVGPSE